MDEESIFMFMLLKICNYEYIRGIEGQRLWQYDWLKNRKSEYGGAFRTIMEQAREDPDQFKKSVRMDYITFTVILNKILKIDTNFRKCISP